MNKLSMPAQLEHFASRAWRSTYTGAMDLARPDLQYRGLRLGLPDRAGPGGFTIDNLRLGTPTRPLTKKDWPALKSYLAEPRKTPPRTEAQGLQPAPLNIPGPGGRHNLVVIARAQNATGFDQIDEARIAAMTSWVTGNRYIKNGELMSFGGQIPMPARALSYAQAADFALPPTVATPNKAENKVVGNIYGDYRDLLGQLTHQFDAFKNPTLGDPSHTTLTLSEWIDDQTQVRWSITLDAELTEMLRAHLIPAAVEAIHAAKTWRRK